MVKPVRWRHRGEWCLLRATLAVTYYLPLGARSVVARCLGAAAFDVLRLRRRVVEHNLMRAFGSSMAPHERRRVGRRCYQELALGALEMTTLACLGAAHLARVCRFRGLEYLAQAQRGGRGCILVTGHFGNWEYLAAALAVWGIPVSAVGAPMRNPLVDRWLTSLRTGLGMELLRTGRGSGREVLRALRAGRVVLLLIDQDAGSHGVFVDFLGNPASTRPGAAIVAQHTGAPVLPCRIDRDAAGHVISILPPIPLPQARGKPAVLHTTQTLTSTLESWIRERPSSWFWPHRRFKTSPPSPDAPPSSTTGKGARCDPILADHQT